MQRAAWMTPAALILIGALVWNWGGTPEISTEQPRFEWTVTEPTFEAPVLRGTILDEHRAPLEGVVIFATQNTSHAHWPLDAPAWSAEELPWKRARTSNDGTFELRGLEPGSVRLSIRAPGRTLREHPWIRVASGERRELQPLVLPPGHRVEGSVLTNEGAPVANASVFFQRPELTPPHAHAWTGSPVALTDFTGAFSTQQMESGPFRLGIATEGFPVHWIEGHLDGPLDLGEVRLPPGDQLQSHAIPLPLGELDDLLAAALPVDAVPFLARPQGRGGFSARWLDGYVTAPISELGEIALEGVRSNTLYSLRLIAEGDELRVVDTWSVPRVIDTTTNRGVLEAHPSVRMSFRVVDAETGELIPDHEHHWVGARSLPRGKVDYLRATSNSGRATLVVEAPGYRTGRTEPLAFVSANSLLTPVVEMQPCPTLSVHVTSREANREVAHARVSLALPDLDGKAVLLSAQETDEQGVAKLNDTPEQARLLAVEAEGYAPAILSPSSRAGQAIRVGLERGGSATVRVTDVQGTPLGGIALRRTPRDELERALFSLHERVVVTDVHGLARFDHLSEGQHSIGIVRESREPATDPWNPRGLLDGLPAFESRLDAPSPGPTLRAEEFGLVEVRAGKVSRLSLITTAPRNLAGVLTQDGQPLIGAVIRLFPAAEPGEFFRSRANAYAVTRTGPGGRFRLEDLPADRVTAMIEHASRTGPTIRTLDLDKRDTEAQLDLESSSLHGLVVNADGEPVPGASLHLPGRWKREARFGPAQGPGDRNLLAWKQTQAEPVVGWTDEAGRFVLPGLDRANPLQLVARSAHDGELQACGGLEIDANSKEVTLGLYSSSTLKVDGFDWKQLERALGVSWRWGQDALHPVQFLVGSSPGSRFRGLSADEWTIFQCELDGWGEICGLRILAPSYLDPVGESRVGIRR